MICWSGNGYSTGELRDARGLPKPAVVQQQGAKSWLLEAMGACVVKTEAGDLLRCCITIPIWGGCAA